MIRLYGIGKTRWNRPYWMLQELGVEFEAIVVDPRIDEHLSAEHLARHPLGKLPVLEDGAVRIFESAAMCLYLGEKFQRLLPAPGTAASALHHQWVFYTLTELEQPLWRMERHRYRYPEAQRLPGDVELARQEFLRAAQVLEAELNDKPYLIGEEFTAADIIIGYAVVWADWDGLLPDFPNLMAYLRRLQARPACPEALLTPPTEHN